MSLRVSANEYEARMSRGLAHRLWPLRAGSDAGLVRRLTPVPTITRTPNTDNEQLLLAKGSWSLSQFRLLLVKPSSEEGALTRSRGQRASAAVAFRHPSDLATLRL